MKKCLSIAFLSLVLSGCFTVVLVGTAAVGVVGMVGYGIYDAGAKVGNFVGERYEKRSAQIAKLFEDGRLVAVEEYSVETVWKSMKSTLVEMKLRDIKGSYDSLSGYLVATNNEGKSVEIALKLVDDGEATEITILIGKAGDTEQSQIILNKLATKLPSKT